MKEIRLVVAAMLFSAGLFGQSSLTGSCGHGGTYPSCVGGEIVFTGNNYPAQVHVTVTNASGEAFDDGDYTTYGGTLSFTENLSFPDIYTISINSQAVLTVTTY